MEPRIERNTDGDGDRDRETHRHAHTDMGSESTQDRGRWQEVE